ncbi:TRAF3-interacting protein 1 [Anopheles bellator]|uniref:TRAF3-interacting protein 1 n=1 Tax=Anopheles bellator TaxID=139047 RepID=UPI002648F8E7|nr:TRAF3-interacting protein 1 [Anopheles bellator]
MATELDAAIVKKTQNSLGKFVKRPALTEKLLRKPPFRFLHDVVHAIIREHGLLEGLWTVDELNSDNIKDRDSKMAFLQKLIDVVKLITGRDLNVRPSKVVAGLEVERTNELLQALGYALEQKLDSSEIVRQFLGGENSGAAVNRSAKEPEERAGQNVDIKKEKSKEKTKDKDQSGNEKKKERITKPKEKEVTKNGVTTAAVPKQEKVKSKQNGSKAGHETKTKSDKPTKGKEKSLKRIPSIPEEQLQQIAPREFGVPETPANGMEQLVSNKQVERRRDSQKEFGEVIADDDNRMTAGEDGALIMENEDEGRKQNGAGSNSSSRRSSLKKQNSLTASENNALSEMNQFNGLENSPGPSRQDSGVGSDPPMRTDKNDALHELGAPDAMPVVGLVAPAENQRVLGKPPMHRQQSIETVMRPRTSLRPPSVRPPSARPGAPRRKEKNVEVILQPNETQRLGEINVKMEVFNNELLDDDGENLIVIEDPISAVDAYATSRTGGLGDDGVSEQDQQQEQQGHLVRQILETQKEFSSHTGHDNETVRKAETEWSIGQRQSSTKQMELLRESIQKLTRSVNPLGKLMDFIQEDVDAMERELTNWQQIFAQSMVELNKERSATENAIEPLKHQLTQIDVNIKEYREMIDSTRANILQNEQKIERLYMTEI